MKKLSALIVPVALAGAVAGWLAPLKQSTRRYIVHLGKAGALSALPLLHLGRASCHREVQRGD